MNLQVESEDDVPPILPSTQAIWNLGLASSIISGYEPLITYFLNQGANFHTYTFSTIITTGRADIFDLVISLLDDYPESLRSLDVETLLRHAVRYPNVFMIQKSLDFISRFTFSISYRLYQDLVQSAFIDKHSHIVGFLHNYFINHVIP